LRIAGLRLLRDLANTTVERIVDIGTGVGLLLPDLSEAFPGALVLGVDRASGVLKTLRGPPSLPHEQEATRRILVHGPGWERSTA
jgi:trans-aconitate methyltransferase